MCSGENVWASTISWVLGRSPNVVIGPPIYLAHRYQCWNNDDQRFFVRSGETQQRATGATVGYVQALVLFSICERVGD